MAGIVRVTQYGLVLSIVKMIYKELRPWLEQQAQKTETPVDDWMIAVLDKLLID
jgi:hypothetical protein